MRSFLRVLVLVSTSTLALIAVQSADAQQPVFIKGACVDKISSDVVSSLKSEIRNSQKYRLAHDLSDKGQMDTVLTIDIDCAERNSVAAVATVFGRAKCFGTKNCHIAVDGTSVRADLCSAGTASECGRSLFKAVDDYAINPVKPRLRLN
jgi:hypothetical protein